MKTQCLQVDGSTDSDVSRYGAMYYFQRVVESQREGREPMYKSGRRNYHRLRVFHPKQPTNQLGIAFCQVKIGILQILSSAFLCRTSGPRSFNFWRLVLEQLVVSSQENTPFIIWSPIPSTAMQGIDSQSTYSSRCGFFLWVSRLNM